MRFQCYADEKEIANITATASGVRRTPLPHLHDHDHHHIRSGGIDPVVAASSASAFHRVSSSPSSASSPHGLHNNIPCCPRVVLATPGSPGVPSTSTPSELLHQHGCCTESHTRHHCATPRCSSGTCGTVSPPNRHSINSALHLSSGLFLNRLGGGGGGSVSAFRPTAKVCSSLDTSTNHSKHKDKQGFRVVRPSSSSPMGNSINRPTSPSDGGSPAKIRRSSSETHEGRIKETSLDVGFSMDKVLSMPKVAGAPNRSPGAALAYLQVQKALEKNYGLPTYDPVVSSSHAAEMPSVAAIRSLHRGPLGLDPYTGYPYRFFPPPGFAAARLPAVFPMHKHGEVFGRLPYKLPYPFLKYPVEHGTTAAPPSALLTPPPEMDLQKYAHLERTLTSQAPGAQFPTPPMGDPQFAFNNQGQKSKRGHLCIYCGKLYSRKYGLKIHLRTHTGYKPLKCKVCLRPFGDPSNLNKHIRLHAEGDTPYRCEHCGKVLVRRRDLERHIRSRHPGEVVDGVPTNGTKTTDGETISVVATAAAKAAAVAAAGAAATKVKCEVEEQQQPEDLTISVDDIDDDDDEEEEHIDCVNDDDSIDMMHEDHSEADKRRR